MIHFQAHVIEYKRKLISKNLRKIEWLSFHDYVEYRH